MTRLPSIPRAPRKVSRHSIRVPVIDVDQKKNSTCGASALYSVVRYYGVTPPSEDAVADAMDFDRSAGSDPADVRRGAAAFGLKWEESRGMSFADLLFTLDQNRPVMLMLQAWSAKANPDYAGWDDGHWVVAIGYDAEVVYFEDPATRGHRAYLSWVDLDGRWHDVEGRKTFHHVHRYGISLWKPGARIVPRKHLGTASWMR